MESNVTPSAEAVARGRASVALASVLLSPTRAFHEIARGASWVWGFVVTVVLSVVGAFLQRPVTDVLSRARLATLPDAQREAAERVMGVQSTMQVVLAPAVVAIGLLLSALIFLGVGRAMGLRLRFKTLFAGMCYAGIVSAIGGIIVAFVSRQRALAGDVTGIADLPRLGLDLLGGEGFVRGLLSVFNLFSVWWLVILVYGVAVLAGRSPRQAMPAVLVAGIVWMLLTGLLTGLAFVSPGS